MAEAAQERRFATAEVDGGSFRDPSGFVFTRDGTLHRQVNVRYAEEYARLMESGLYGKLVDEGLLVRHEDAGKDLAVTPDAHTVLTPERVPFVSYPYEWCFSQLKDAALLTLRVHELALDHGMWLKDASAYNVQFTPKGPVFIDTLSFEQRPEGEPWVAYRQFCEHFLAPLALMSLTDVRTASLLRAHLDGVPLDLAARLLPWRSRLKPGLLLHVHAHARAQTKYEDASKERRPTARVSANALRGVVDSLRGTIRGLDWKPGGTAWADYYANTNYSDDAFDAKKALVDRFVGDAGPDTVWDLGANTGAFSRIAAARGAFTLAFDVDPAAVERHYRDAEARGDRVLPLVMDLANPSPALGWAHSERHALKERGPADLVLALALVHHLRVTHNVPFDMMARLFRDLAPNLVVEFVPRTDSQARRLLAGRQDAFPDYSREAFEQAFGRAFRIAEAAGVPGSERILYRMEALSA